mmetsp:Transcript_23518/g.50966  ORF Transcript_23518/g.50966 Transcript_23518/m.50966 type:complete len:194 (-) Transcript_23518:117-698(-)|eukprot:CAMPEP_0172309640 /NCGR_PEP_ID=MMETSP1058-20130122/10310_1 /TAXON_ID=83371 /ORGANISM="Detonula confervacea, Strain CCMP 353" /LENGTH=193 /DNA_ID=CAMNT_0013022299 /DNA_START=99 /DNA_END=680 /DNA_ORIENTATION=+
MRSFAFVLSLMSLSFQCTDGFSTLAKTPSHTMSNPSRTALSATNDDRKVDFRHKAANIAATLALGWAVGSSSSLAAPLSSNDWTAASSCGSSSSFVVAFSDSDFTDFSLPSYKEVTDSAINANLKGGKQLFGEDAVAAASSPSGSAAAVAPAAVQKKEPTAAELKAAKVAAKAEQNAARARQQAAVEAAAAAK